DVEAVHGGVGVDGDLTDLGGPVRRNGRGVEIDVAPVVAAVGVADPVVEVAVHLRVVPHEALGDRTQVASPVTVDLSFTVTVHLSFGGVPRRGAGLRGGPFVGGRVVVARTGTGQQRQARD